MLQSRPLFPVYDPRLELFFVSPEVLKPTVVNYPEDDRYGRKEHKTQFLKVPVTIPNYLGLCSHPDQKPWGAMDEIDPTSLQVKKLLVSCEINGVEKHFSVETHTSPSSGFIPTPYHSGRYTLILRPFSFFGMGNQNFAEVVNHDETVFADLKNAGYEPLIKISLLGKFDRQFNSLALGSSNGMVEGVRCLSSGEVTPLKDTSGSVSELLNMLGPIAVIGAEFRQSLK